jgi:hypothetical protein
VKMHIQGDGWWICTFNETGGGYAHPSWLADASACCRTGKARALPKTQHCPVSTAVSALLICS